MIASIPSPRSISRAIPEVLFEVRPLDKGVHVLIFDHPEKFRVILNRDDYSADGARFLTDATRTNMAHGHWNRSPGGLWINT